METTLKPRRSVIKRQKKEANKLAKAQGAVKSRLMDVPTSPRKMRLVADIIRGKRVSEAIAILDFQPKAGAITLKKVLLTAISDWKEKNSSANIDEADLFIKTLFVDCGKVLKRLRPAPQGRAYRVRKRSNHITMVVDSLVSIDKLVAPKVEEKKEEPKKTTKASAKTTEKKETKKTKKSE